MIELGIRLIAIIVQVVLLIVKAEVALAYICFCDDDRVREVVFLFEMIILYRIFIRHHVYPTEKKLSLIYGQRKNFFELKKVLLIFKKISFIPKNRFVYIKEIFF